MKSITFKYLYFIFGLLVFQSGLMVSCKKGFEVPLPPTSLRITNTILGVNLLYTSFQGTEPLKYYASAARIFNNSSNALGNYIKKQSGDVPLALYRVEDTLNPALPFMELSLSLLPNCYYSLFLSGTANNPESLFIKEQFEPIKDSAAGIRFVNLSPGSEAMSVNLLGHQDNPEVDDLPYKSLSAFILYPAHAKVSSYTFEIRDKRTGDLLTSYTTSSINSYIALPGSKNAWIFNRSTLMVTGLRGGTGESALKVELINHM